MNYSNSNPQTDLEKLKVLAYSNTPPTNIVLLQHWLDKASTPILKKYLNEWINQLNGGAIVSDVTYDEAVAEIKKEKSGIPAFATGGTVGSVKEYFESIDLSRLPETAQVFIKEQLMNPPADLKFDNPEFLRIRGLIDELIKPQARIEEAVAVEVPERTVVVSPPVTEVTNVVENKPSLEEVVAAAKKAQEKSKSTLYIYKHPATGLIYFTDSQVDGDEELEVLPYEIEATVEEELPAVEENEEASAIAEINGELENILPALEFVEGEDKVELEEKIQSLRDALSILGGTEKHEKGGYLYDHEMFPFALTALNQDGTRVVNDVYVSRSAAQKVKDLFDPKWEPKIVKNIYKKGGAIGGSPQREMDKTALSMLVEYSAKLFELKGKAPIPAWADAKISKAEFTVAAVKHNLESKHPELFATGGELNASQYAKMQLKHINKYSKSLLQHFDKLEFEAWMSSLLFVAADYLDGIFHYVDYTQNPKLKDGGKVDPGVWHFVLRTRIPSTDSSSEYQYMVEFTSPSGKRYASFDTWSAYKDSAREAKVDIMNRLMETGAIDALVNDEILSDSNGNPYFVLSEESGYAKGGELKKDSHYISFLNKDNGFKETKKYFDTYEKAVKWGRKNLENFNLDMVRIELASGGHIVYNGGFKEAEFETGGSANVAPFYVVGKKDKQLVDITEYPMSKADCERWIKEQGIERQYTNVDIIPYHGKKPILKYQSGGNAHAYPEISAETQSGDIVKVIFDNEGEDGEALWIFLRPAEAKKAYEANMEVYRLYDDGSEALVEDPEEIEEGNDYGLEHNGHNLSEWSKLSGRVYARGGAVSLSEPWVLYSGIGHKIDVYKSRSAAKRAMDKLWATGEYDELGIQLESEFNKEKGSYSHGGPTGSKKKLDWRVGKGLGAINYNYGFNNGIIYVTDQHNLTPTTKAIKDIELVFRAKASSFISEADKLAFIAEMVKIFPELTKAEIEEALIFADKD